MDKIKHRKKPLTSSPAETEEEFTRAAKATATPGEYTRKYKRGEPCKLKAFNLPLSMIKKIQEEADEHTDGNASSMALKIFNSYFTGKN